MCGGALYWSQLDKIVIGARDDKRGASTVGDLYHPKTSVVQGIMENECQSILKEFFRSKR